MWEAWDHLKTKNTWHCTESWMTEFQLHMTAGYLTSLCKTIDKDIYTTNTELEVTKAAYNRNLLWFNCSDKKPNSMTINIFSSRWERQQCPNEMANMTCTSSGNDEDEELWIQSLLGIKTMTGSDQECFFFPRYLWKFPEGRVSFFSLSSVKSLLSVMDWISRASPFFLVMAWSSWGDMRLACGTSCLHKL